MMGYLVVSAWWIQLTYIDLLSSFLHVLWEEWRPVTSVPQSVSLGWVGPGQSQWLRASSPRPDPHRDRSGLLTSSSGASPRVFLPLRSSCSATSVSFLEGRFHSLRKSSGWSVSAVEPEPPKLACREREPQISSQNSYSASWPNCCIPLQWGLDLVPTQSRKWDGMIELLYNTQVNMTWYSTSVIIWSISVAGGKKPFQGTR